MTDPTNRNGGPLAGTAVAARVRRHTHDDACRHEVLPLDVPGLTTCGTCGDYYDPGSLCPGRCPSTDCERIPAMSEEFEHNTVPLTVGELARTMGVPANVIATLSARDLPVVGFVAEKPGGDAYDQQVVTGVDLSARVKTNGPDEPPASVFALIQDFPSGRYHREGR